MNNARQTGAVLEAHFQFMQWLFPAIARFPRSQKLLLTDRIQSIALDVLESLVEATYTREKALPRVLQPPGHHDDCGQRMDEILAEARRRSDRRRHG
jgi:hypothetical protein